MTIQKTKPTEQTKSKTEGQTIDKNPDTNKAGDSDDDDQLEADSGMVRQLRKECEFFKRELKTLTRFVV